MAPPTTTRSSDADVQARLRQLPSIDEVLKRESLSKAFAPHSHETIVRACRQAVELVRARILAGEPRELSDFDVIDALSKLLKPKLRSVINATGVVLHTNLGRAPLSERAIAHVSATARGYSNLELDLATGERGSRYSHVQQAVCTLTGAESAIVVNNGAAAVLLALASIGQGREAIVSRGELVEIGGGFRVPDVMEQSGVALVEVGTTNKTRTVDYEKAITDRTALLVKVHRSNFAIIGFTEETSTAELSALGRSRGVVVYEDLGSGLLFDFPQGSELRERSVAAAIRDGADLVSFSGDKLLGGPQAGIIAGKRSVIERLEKHPLNRALRVDKLTIAALEATLAAYLDGTASDTVPVQRLLHEDSKSVERRAHALAALIRSQHVECSIIGTDSQVGGGSLPLSRLPSFAVAIDHPKPDQVHERLRHADPPVLARIEQGAVILDLRCVFEAELERLSQCVVLAVRGNEC